MKKKTAISSSAINVPTKGNKILEKVLKRANDDEELKVMWDVINVNAIERRKMIMVMFIFKLWQT